MQDVLDHAHASRVQAVVLQHGQIVQLQVVDRLEAGILLFYLLVAQAKMGHREVQSLVVVTETTDRPFCLGDGDFARLSGPCERG